MAAASLTAGEICTRDVVFADRGMMLDEAARTWHREGPEPAALGDRLLSHVADAGADLLVMGCYGRSRAREWVLGGVSRTVLASMTVPVLLAH